MKYDVIIFDADETLFDFKKSEKVAFASTLKEFDIKGDDLAIFNSYKKINTTIWKDLENGLITQEKLKIERFRKLADHLNESFDPELFADKFMTHLSLASFIYNDATTLLDAISTTHRLLILTNGLTRVQENRISKSDIAHYFETVVISEEVNISKPDPRIFEHALSTINYTDKSKVLMVGDSLSSDIQGGINFGIDTCWYNPNKLENTTDLSPTYNISDLMEIVDITNK